MESSFSHPVIVAISGVKNAGKTTLITRMLPHLAAAGVLAAVVKHDGHSFAAEPPDTDTGRFLQAGACGAAIFDADKYKIIRRQRTDEAALAALFPEAALVLLEGGKHTRWPKLEVVRTQGAPVCDPSTLLALVTDLPLALPGVPCVSPDDAAGAAAILLRYLRVREGGGGHS